jgi:hypothetical protein
MTQNSIVLETEEYIIIDGKEWGMPGYHYQIGNVVFDGPIGPFETVDEAAAAADTEIKEG